jgi:hypothetical protein
LLKHCLIVRELRRTTRSSLRVVTQPRATDLSQSFLVIDPSWLV